MKNEKKPGGNLPDGTPALIDKTFPLPARFRSSLPADVAELSRLLTSGRGERSLSYLGRPAMLSAYLRYFLPWNLYRLCRLLPGLEIPLAAGDRLTDLGCGPLTFTLALWLCRPKLRTVPLEFRCIDRSGPALDAGKKLFAALAGEDSPWKIHTVKGDINNFEPRSTRSFTEKDKKSILDTPCSVVCAINVFNEMYGDISRSSSADSMKRNAEKAARLLASHGTEGARFLIVEPGFPRCGEFISCLRDVFLARGHLGNLPKPLAPCTHNGDCPFPGGEKRGKKRWCHFAFDTSDAPADLHRLSRAAGLPKERATLSFLYAGPAEAEANARQGAGGGKTPCPSVTPVVNSSLRVISDAFALPPGKYGRYGCAPQGLVLLSGEKAAIEKVHSGALVTVAINNEKRDAKSGALIAELR